MISMADWAVNKAPGGRTGLDNPRPTRSFVLFQGPPHPVTPPRSTRSQAVTNPRKTGHQASELRKVKGSGGVPGYQTAVPGIHRVVYRRWRAGPAAPPEG